MNARLTYVYGVVHEDAVLAGAEERDGPPAELRGVTGVAGAPVHTVRHAGLAALTSPVPAEDFDEAGLRRHLEDMAWLEAAARAHQGVVDHAARTACVLPLRLGTVCHDEEGVRRLLDEGHDRFSAAIAALEGRVEWGVKVFTETEPETKEPQEPAAPSPTTGDGTGAGGTGTGTGSGTRTRTVPSRGAGRAYLRQRGQARRTEEERTARADACARGVHDILAGLAERHRLHRPQHPELSGERAENLLNAAYLVPDGQSSAEFARRVTELAESKKGVRIELTGPWAPYSFAEVVTRDAPAHG
ncbi:GvpL/GvpF family gas vesicle protein [Streptomyces daliensis]|uniref:GvpL/GvpF family gas vesicle protein n=1 Tax=Streptomyces daliensis TaxID=299421 RepID=A0A8T4IJ56_9ACTN|nr:GvpL/GvpF family gas vesicle protein [Streptomyces daliensis]